MTRILLILVLFFGCMLGMTVLGSSDAHAQVATAFACPKASVPAGFDLTARAAYCVKKAIYTGIGVYLPMVRDFATPIIGMVFVLAMTLFGMRLMSVQVENLGMEAMTLIFKMALVSYFVFSFEDYYPALFGTIDQFTAMLARALNSFQSSCTVPTGGSITLTTTPVLITETYAQYDIWFKMDCILNRVFGAGGGIYLLNSSMLAFMAAALFTGLLGVMLFMVAFTAVLSFLFMVMRSILLVLAGYLSLGFMTILSPFALPTLMFKRTTPHFLKWMSLVASSIIQPIFMLAFMGFVIVLVEGLILGGQNFSNQAVRSFNEIVGISNGDSAAKIAADTRSQINSTTPKCSWTVPADKKIEEASGKQVPDSAKLNSFWERESINICKIFQPFSLQMQNEGSKIKAMLVNMIAWLLVTYIAMKMMYEIPNMAHQVAGTAGYALSAIAQLPRSIEEIATKASKAMEEGLKSSAGGKGLLTGGGFSGAFKNIKGMGKGMARGGVGAGKETISGAASGATEYFGSGGGAV